MKKFKTLISFIWVLILVGSVGVTWGAEKQEKKEDAPKDLGKSGSVTHLTLEKDLKAEAPVSREEYEALVRRFAELEKLLGSEKGEAKSGAFLLKRSSSKDIPTDSLKLVTEKDLIAKIEALEKDNKMLKADMGKFNDHVAEVVQKRPYVLKDFIATDKIRWMMYGITIYYGISEMLVVYTTSSSLSWYAAIPYAIQKGLLTAFVTFSMALSGGWAVGQISTVVSDITDQIKSKKTS
ncbi:MAG: hypothetical protein FJX71_01360 [Alphaproteobacteria bacterium]|nr:hypothetical protein [Alphaproteobacteria bacterium]